MNEEQENNEQELSKEAPTLFGIEKPKLSGGLNVPDGYFESIRSRVDEQLTSEEPESKVIPLFSRKNILFAISAAAVLAIIAWANIGNEETSKVLHTTTLVADNASDAEISGPELETMSVNDFMDELIEFPTENEDELLEDNSDYALLASLDEDEFFDEFFDFEEEDLDMDAPIDLTIEELESIEGYFSGDSEDFSLDIY